MHVGYPVRAQELSAQALALAKELPDLHNRAYALTFSAYLYQCRRDIEETEHLTQAVLTACAGHELPDYSAWATILRGWTVAERGYRQEGIAYMKQGLIALQATGERTSSAYHLTVLAEQWIKAGDYEQALKTLEEAAELVAKGIRLYEPELHRLRGEVLLITDRARAAEASFCRAVEVSRQHHNKSLELRASTCLARLLAQLHRRDEALIILTDIYNWFTEGFDTPDLKDAKALLDELRA